MAKKNLEKWLLLLMFLLKNEASSLRCDRRPYGSTTQASPSDGRYQLNVLGADDTYLPEQTYTVQLTRTDDESEFIAFVVSAEAELKQDPRNPRRLLAQNPGELRPQATGKYSDRCLYSVEQTSYNTKSSVEVSLFHIYAPIVFVNPPTEHCLAERGLFPPCVLYRRIYMYTST